MDIGKLKAFIVVAEELNFRRSAEILGMSQPPLTRLIAQLEKDLEVKLFERSTRSVKLTSAGIVLLKEAKEIQNALERIETDVRMASKMKTGFLKIGVSRAAHAAQMSEIILDFQQRFPKVQTEVYVETVSSLLKKVESGLLDVAITEADNNQVLLKSQMINLENIGALLPLKHPLSKKTVLQLSDLKNETVILHHKNEAKEFHHIISRAFGRLNKKPQIYIKQDTESCPLLVATGKGISLTVAGSEQVSPKHTKFIPIKDLFLPLSLFWKETNQSAHLNTFISFVIENKTLNQKPTRCLNLSEA